MSRVLLVDDDQVMAQGLARLLARHHHSVEVSANATDAMARVRAERFDLVITDFQMPDLDGLALAAQIIAAAPGTPIILLTGSFDVDLQRVKAAGVVEVIAKPANPDQLLESVRRHARRGVTERFDRS